MRANRRTMGLVALCALPATSLCAQDKAGSRVLPLIHRQRIDTSMLAERMRVQTDSQSTTAERFVGGFVLGSLVALGTTQLVDEGPHAIYAYVVGSAVGVVSATVAREKPRPLAVLVGTAFGALPLLAVASADEGSPAVLSILLVGWITTPLLGAVGQRW